MTTEEYFFDALKSHRESKNIEISEICDYTKISPKYIEAIENGDFSVLPIIYMRLFLREYADYIGADSKKTLEDYELYTTGKVVPKEDTSSSSELDQKSISSKNLIDSYAEQIPPKKIIVGTSVIVGIFLILFWASKITNEQSLEINTQTTQNTSQIESINQDSIIVTKDDLQNDIDKKKDQ